MSEAEVIKGDKLGKHKTLVCMVGLPYSGKSTEARLMIFPIVCPDAIRIALHGHKFIPEAEPYIWAIARTMVRSLFIAGHDVVVLDATNTTEERREKWISMDWETEWSCIRTPAYVCLERAREAGDIAIIPIIEKMAEKLTFPEGE